MWYIVYVGANETFKLEWLGFDLQGIVGDHYQRIVRNWVVINLPVLRRVKIPWGMCVLTEGGISLDSQLIDGFPKSDAGLGAVLFQASFSTPQYAVIMSSRACKFQHDLMVTDENVTYLQGFVGAQFNLRSDDYWLHARVTKAPEVDGLFQSIELQCRLEARHG